MDQLVEEMHNGLKLFHEGPSYFYATAFSRDMYLWKIDLMIKVRQSRKQILVSYILPKNKR